MLHLVGCILEYMFGLSFVSNLQAVTIGYFKKFGLSFVSNLQAVTIGYFKKFGFHLNYM